MLAFGRLSASKVGAELGSFRICVATDAAPLEKVVTRNIWKTRNVKYLV